MANEIKKVGLVTFRRDRYGKVVDPDFPYCTYTEDEAKKIFKRRKANKVARKQRKINRKRNKR